jgi:hypothetical protein
MARQPDRYLLTKSASARTEIDINPPQRLDFGSGETGASRILCERSNRIPLAVPKNVAFNIVFSLTNRHGAFIAQQRLFAYKPGCSALSAQPLCGSGIRTSSYRLPAAQLCMSPGRALSLTKTCGWQKYANDL